MNLTRIANDASSELLTALGLVVITRALWKDIRSKSLTKYNLATADSWTFALLCIGLANAIRQAWWLAAPLLLLGMWRLREGRQ